MRETRRGACVCVSGHQLSPTHPLAESKPQDGAASPPRSRGLRPRHFRYRTTTNYILSLYCSSKGRECYFNVTYAGGGRRV